MQRLLKTLLCGVVSLVIAWPAQGQTGKSPRSRKADAPAIGAVPELPVPLKGDAIAGKAKSEDERCQECHGHDGNANDIQDGVGNIGKFPRLAGQRVEYIIKQFSEFRSGKRNNEVMSIMAKTVSNADLADIAAYFSSQRRVPGESRGESPVGKNLFFNGDSSRGILPCVGCHSERGSEVSTGNPETPLIAGQHRRYLLKQLTEWRAGERRNSPGGIMNSLAKQLKDEEINALADYVSGL